MKNKSCTFSGYTLTFVASLKLPVMTHNFYSRFNFTTEQIYINKVVHNCAYMQSPMVGQYSDKVKISGSTPDAKVPQAH